LPAAKKVYQDLVAPKRTEVYQELSSAIPLLRGKIPLLPLFNSAAWRRRKFRASARKINNLATSNPVAEGPFFEISLLFPSSSGIKAVAAAEASGPTDAVDCGISALTGALKIAADCGDAEFAAAIGDEPGSVASGAGVEDPDFGVGRRRGESANFAAGRGLVGKPRASTTMQTAC
jgi:hypothetical protein